MLTPCSRIGRSCWVCNATLFPIWQWIAKRICITSIQTYKTYAHTPLAPSPACFTTTYHRPPIYCISEKNQNRISRCVLYIIVKREWFRTWVWAQKWAPPQSITVCTNWIPVARYITEKTHQSAPSVRRSHTICWIKQNKKVSNSTDRVGGLILYVFNIKLIDPTTIDGMVGWFECE